MALEVITHGKNATLDLEKVKSITAMTKADSTTRTILDSILSLFKKKSKSKIIENTNLNRQLTDLANNISSKNDDEKKIKNLIKAFYN